MPFPHARLAPPFTAPKSLRGRHPLPTRTPTPAQDHLGSYSGGSVTLPGRVVALCYSGMKIAQQLEWVARGDCRT